MPYWPLAQPPQPVRHWCYPYYAYYTYYTYQTYCTY